MQLCDLGFEWDKNGWGRIMMSRTPDEANKIIKDECGSQAFDIVVKSSQNSAAAGGMKSGEASDRQFSGQHFSPEVTAPPILPPPAKY